MSVLDHVTLLIIASLVSFVLAITQLIYGYFRYEFRPALDMGIASLLFSARLTFHLFESRLPPALVILPIMAVGFEVLLIYRAVRGSLGYDPMSRSDIGMFFFFMALGFIAGFATSYSIDQVIHAVYVLYFFSRAFVLSLKSVGRIPFSMLVFLLFYIAAVGFIMTFRGLYYLFADVQAELYSSDPMTVSTTLLSLMAFLIGNLGVFILSITRVLEGALEERDFARVLVSVVGHDLNGYIGNVRQAAELLSDRSDPAIPTLSNQIAKAQDLLTDLVYWGRSRDGAVQGETVAAVLSAIVESVVREACLTGTDKKAEIVVPDEIPPRVLLVDPVSAAVVLRNILTNALKFSPEGGKVRMSFQDSADEVRIRIVDSGRGMPPDLLKAVRNGHRVNSAGGTAGEKGLGVGLRIIGSICRASGWSLEFESLPELGTAVTIGFPKVPEDAEDTPPA